MGKAGFGIFPAGKVLKKCAGELQEYDRTRKMR